MFSLLFRIILLHGLLPIRAHVIWVLVLFFFPIACIAKIWVAVFITALHAFTLAILSTFAFAFLRALAFSFAFFAFATTG